MAKALINPKILIWARERVNLTQEELAKKLNVKPEKVLSWENGKDKPTFLQAQNIANKLHIPFGFLYLEEIPQLKLPIPDLRTFADKQQHKLSNDVVDLIYDIKFKQDWYRDYLLEQGIEKLAFAGRFKKSAGYREIAEDITKTLDLRVEHRKEAKNWEEFLQLLMQKGDDLGIWVMRSGIVGNNTHRTLDVKEFRGFVLFDEIAPVVFINGRDAKAAQIFTLIHELAHIWIGESGISDIHLGDLADMYNGIEKLCNQVAAEVLVPQKLFYEYWQGLDSIEELNRFFKVSSVVIARRAFDLKLISWDEYRGFYTTQQQKWQEYQRRQKKQSGGQMHYTLPVRYGKSFTDALIRATLNGQVMLKDAANMLGLKPSKIFSLAKKMGVA